MKTYDVVIIGAGTAGLSARREVAKKTDNYLVVDGGPLGTTCARVGCMPSKVLLQVAEDFHRRHSLEEQGVQGSEALSIDEAKVLTHVRKLRDRFVRAVVADIDSWKEKHLVQAYAKIVDSNTLEINEEKVKAKKIIIATGSTPIYPKAWDQYRSYFLDTNDFFELEKFPKKIAVIGTGVIGLELGQAMSRLGVDVVLIGNTKSLGGLSDPKIQDYSIEKFSKEMPLYLDGADIVGEENGQLKIKSGEKEFLVDKVLLAVGRRPNLDHLGLENLNIDKTDRGLPIYSQTTYQIKNQPIYFVGDVNNEAPVLHEASDQGRIAGYNAVREESQCFTQRSLLRITFSSPNIAIVGKQYKDLDPEQILIGEVSYEGQGRAIVKLKESGMVRIYADKKTGKLLGAEIFAPEGEHLAHLLSWALSLNMTIPEILSLPFYHPVLEEGLRTALRKIAHQLEEIGDFELFRCEENPFSRA